MFYVLDEKGNKIEAYDKQGVLALLEQAIADGDLESIASDSAFVDKIKCCVGTGTHHIAFVPQATYNELKANGELIADAYYFITDDTTAEDMSAQLETLTDTVNDLVNYSQPHTIEYLGIDTNIGSLSAGYYAFTYNTNTAVPSQNEQYTFLIYLQAEEGAFYSSCCYDENKHIVLKYQTDGTFIMNIMSGSAKIANAYTLTYIKL